jgi:hypothetical protein
MASRSDSSACPLSSIAQVIPVDAVPSSLNLIHAHPMSKGPKSTVTSVKRDTARVRQTGKAQHGVRRCDDAAWQSPAQHVRASGDGHVIRTCDNGHPPTRVSSGTRCPACERRCPSRQARGDDATHQRARAALANAARALGLWLWRRLRPRRGACAAHQGCFGAPDRIRTCDLRLRRPTLYPLSYRRARRQSYRVAAASRDDGLAGLGERGRPRRCRRGLRAGSGGPPPATAPRGAS